MDHKDTFDKENFARLLDRAKGNRSINKYAEDSQVSAAHISRFLRKMLDTPPSPETIAKLAAQAYNEVSYRDLMIAAGHIAMADENNDNSSNRPVPTDDRETRIERTSPYERQMAMENLEKKLFQVVLSYLYEVPFKWSIQKPEGRLIFPDLMVDIDHQGYTKWLIEFKGSLNPERMMPMPIFHFYGQLASLEFKPTDKVTLAVNSEISYNHFFKRPPLSLRINLYVMLVDLDKGKVVKEELLCKYE